MNTPWNRSPTRSQVDFDTTYADRLTEEFPDLELPIAVPPGYQITAPRRIKAPRPPLWQLISGACYGALIGAAVLFIVLGVKRLVS